MIWTERQTKGILLVSGALTSTMVYAAISPKAAFLSTFGEPLEGAAATLVVRNWGALITTIGGMLLYGAFHPPVRLLVVAAAGLTKLIFIAFVLANGTRYLTHQAGVAVAIDSIFVLIFAAYLLGRTDVHGGN